MMDQPMRPMAATPEATAQFVTLRLNGQLIGLPIAQVRDVFQINEVTPIPHAEASVHGLVNLRGRIILLFSLAGLLGLPAGKPGKTRMAVGVDWRGETYGIQIDDIGDVIELPLSQSENFPTHLGQSWTRHASRIHKLEAELMVELDITALLESPLVQAA